MTLQTDAVWNSSSKSKERLDPGALPFILSVFLGATLIFLVQPMFARMATPLLGGSPSVWNVSLVCFQAALLAGYGYAHLLARLRSVRLQVIIHGAALMLGLICLPMGITGMFGEPDTAHPAIWLMGVFIVSVALPFGTVSATAPLIQSWYARTRRKDAGDPYHLYAASNVGSLIGLAAYPLLLEPFSSVAVQSMIWTVGYGVLFLLLMTSGVSALRQFNKASVAHETGERRAVLSWSERLKWIGLAFIPSSLLVGTTTHITTDVAAAPFLWVPPLTLYLLTFVLVFARREVIPMAVILRFQPLVIAAVLLMLPRVVSLGWSLELGITLLGLFWASMTCHGLLAARRPHVSRLTEFYLLMSVGGVLGGAFNALLAPVLFESVLEYPLVLALSLLVLPASKPDFDRRGRLVIIAVLTMVCAALLLPLTLFSDTQLLTNSLMIIPVLGIVFARERRWVMLICFMAAYSIGLIMDPFSGGKSERGFFGIVKVLEGDGYRTMMHGTTLHGAQLTDTGERLRPLTYYAPDTPIGQTFRIYKDAKTVGIVGLGVGSVACYGQPGQSWVFYEIDPIVVDLATNPDQFTFMSECQPDARIVTGDARIKLAHEPNGFFDLLLLDAFSSDAIPLHLVTKEAMDLYLSKLSDDGVFIAHISNRHIALEKVFARLAAEEGIIAMEQFSVPADKERSLDETPTHAMIFARNEKALKRAIDTGLWSPVESDGKRVWTDDYSNILGAMIEHAQRHKD